MVNGKARTILLIVGLIKKIYYTLENIFLNRYVLGGNMKVELDLSKYVTQSDLKNATGLATSSVAKNVDWKGRLKPKTDKLDIGKFETATVGLS